MRELAIYRGYRVVEVLDATWSLSELEGEAYRPEVNPDIEPAELLRQQKEFRRKVNNEGVYGYVLERWNPEVGAGWEYVDSCYGFVGPYNAETNRHYIVDELFGQVK